MKFVKTTNSWENWRNKKLETRKKKSKKKTFTKNNKKSKLQTFSSSKKVPVKKII